MAGSSYLECVDRLEQVLARFKEYKVKVNEPKCKFLHPIVDYLGCRLCAERNSPQESIIEDTEFEMLLSFQIRMN